MDARFFSRALRVAAIGILVSLTACGGAQSRLAGHLERGKEYFAEGSWKKASVEFRNALQIDPKNVEAHLLNGRVAEQLGDVREAVRGYQTVIELQPEGVDGPASLARLYVFAGAPAKALEIVEPVLVKHPGNPDLLTVRGAARAQQKDLPGALEDAEAAVKAAPANENAVALLASLYRQSKQSDRAVQIVTAAVAANPKSVDLRQILASLGSEAGANAVAEEQLRQVIELRPEDLAHRTRLALFYARTQRLDEAQRTLEAAVKAMPDSNEAKLQLVDFIANQRSSEQGEKALRAFIANDRKNLELKLGLGALLQREKNNARALVVYRDVVAADDTSPSALTARNRIASMQVESHDFNAARVTINETLQRNPRDNDALTLRAGLALERHDAASAIADLRAVLRDQPQAVTVRRTLARAHFENHEAALAEDVLREAMQIAPDDLQLRIDLAQLMSETQRPEQAVTLLEEAVRKAPADARAREMLVRADLAIKDFTAARTATDDLKTLRPNGASGFYLAGLVAQAQGRPDDALSEFKRALELQPDALDALAGYARLQAGRGKVDDAVTRVRAAVDQNPHNAVARNLLGELQLMQKSYAAAAEQFAGAMADSPAWPVPYRNLALAKIAAKDLAGGTAAYESGLKPTNYAPELVADLGALYERQGKADAAIALYEQLHQRDPQANFAANNLAMLLVTYRTDKASLDRARQLTESFANSDSGSLLDTSGWVRFKTGDNQDALPLLERAANRAPDSRVIRFHLAMAQLQAGQHDKARDNLEVVLKDDTGFSGRDEARAALDNLKRRAG